MNLFNREQTSTEQSHPAHPESGKVRVKFFWKTSLIISVVLTVLGTIILNLIFNG